MKLSYSSDSAAAYLERLLSFALRDGAHAAAVKLVSKYGTIDMALAAPVDELVTVAGMTKNAAVLLSLTAALGSRRITDDFPFGEVPTDTQIKRFLVALYLGVAVETVYLLLFDGEGSAISCEYIGEGTVSASDVYPRRLLEATVRRGASSAILVHNHPRASGKPSNEDVQATDRINAVFESAGVLLRAHYVVCERNVAEVPIKNERVTL